MPGNSFGYVFRITSFGESHGPSLGGIIDGCPSGLTIDFDFIQSELKRRQPFYAGSTDRKEPDEVEWLSGLNGTTTLGTPIAFQVRNVMQETWDYEEHDFYRPSHADYSFEIKYGIRDRRGGGRASGRETIVRVVAGAIAKTLLRKLNLTFEGFVSQIGPIVMPDFPDPDPDGFVQSSFLKLTDPLKEPEVLNLLQHTQEQGDTYGGSVSCRIKGVMPGLGEPVFDKLQADLAKAVMSIGTAKAFEYGLGFRAAAMRGSDHNDKMTLDHGKIAFTTNHDGGIQGGISNGEEIYFRVAFKPVPSIHQPQQMVGSSGQTRMITLSGRHDTCHVPRLVVIVESMAALVVADHFLRCQLPKL